MKLTRLRLLGFKSFVEPTDFLIEPGLTGVVGPNGCGKSNLVEALRWVMGESSHKSMRAASMDDVIFSGSNSRPARNNAEVAIAIDNSTRSAPAAFNDHDSLEIARRIERDSGSSYRINGRDVRARDVQIVFADASTGARSPALVHQGRIGEIIQAKPEQRRRVLEEAAGIAGLHARRHEAELRLKAAETNLLRVEDVIGQLSAQIDGLKKQARQAIRYRTVSSQVRKAEATLYHLRWSSANSEVTEAEHAKDVSVRTVADRVGAEAEASKRQALAAASLPELREAEAHAGAALHRLNVAQRDLDREETRAKDRIVELDLRLVQFAADTEREQRLAADAEQAIARLVAEEEAIRAEARESAGRRRGVDAKVSEADTELGAAERIFADRTTELADLAAQRNLFENAAREQSERISRISSEIEAIERELATLPTGDVGPLAVAMEGTQVALSEAEAAAIAAEAAHNVARAEMETAQATLAESEKRVQRLETEAKTLSKMLSLETRSLWPPVIDHISVEKGYEKALGAALGDDLDAPVDPSSPMHWSGIAHEADDPALPDGVATLAQYVKAPAQLTRRLSQIGVVERDAAIRLASSLKTGQRLVSREGDLWRWDGFVAAAHAPTGAARRLAQRSRFAEIDSELVSARSEVDANRRTVETAQAAFKAASSVETETRARERDLNRQAARLSALAEARARLNTSRDEATTAKADAEGSLIRLAPAAHLETKLAQVRDEISGKRARLAEVRAEQQAIVREAELADRRLTTLAADRTGWIERQQGARKQIATLEQRTVEARRDRTELENAPQIFAEKRRALIAEVQTAETARQDCADRLQAAETALATADRDARAALEAASAAREEFARAEERFEAAKRRLSD
ncbi:MAG: chromosome segregation SMC family protein, partial [Pseudolabrys sp.]